MNRNPKKGFTLIELLLVIGILALLASIAIVVINPGELLARSRDVQRLHDLATVRDSINIYLSRSTNPSLGSVCNFQFSYPPYENSTIDSHKWRSSTGGINDAAAVAAFIPIQAVMNSAVPALLVGNYSLGLPAIFSPFTHGYGGGANTSFAYNDTEVWSEYINQADVRKINGTGWASIPFNTLTDGSPLTSLPVDPINKASNDYFGQALVDGGGPLTAGHFYSYICDNTKLQYQIDTRMESQKYGGVDLSSLINPVYAPDNIQVRDGGKRACGWFADFSSGQYLCDPVGFGAPATLLADQLYQIGNSPGLSL